MRAHRFDRTSRHEHCGSLAPIMIKQLFGVSQIYFTWCRSSSAPSGARNFARESKRFRMTQSIRFLEIKNLVCLGIAVCLALGPSLHFRVVAQDATAGSGTKATRNLPNNFRLERTDVAGGAELLTVFGTLDGLPANGDTSKEVPLVSVLRDTLGDTNPANDRLRYVWMLTYTRPTLWQRAAAAVPFLYGRLGSKKDGVDEVPPAIMDISNPEHRVWNKVFWAVLQNLFLDGYGIPLKASTRSYRRNIDDYRSAHIVRALAILSLFQAETGTSSVFSSEEISDIQARLMLTEKTLGGIVDDIYLQRVYETRTTNTLDIRGHNWELLRQRSEAESLYFEPLQLPDGSATHAMLWVAKDDLPKYSNRDFNSRFLNIANPWKDKRLHDWGGYSETRYFDENNRPISPDTPGAHPTELIPLALYGLDHPKIPILLVDFRDGFNAKKREMSHRVLEDITRNVLSLSRFGDLHYFLGRTVYDFVTGRRGMDINQPSRLRTYSQLKLLLSLESSLDPELRRSIGKRLERASTNPLENDYTSEAKLAREQYQALLDYARKPDGLSVRLEKDRRQEMTAIKHGRTANVFFRAANILSFGGYTHREESTPELQLALDERRQIAYHTRFLREVSRSSPRVEVSWSIEEVRQSLAFLVEHGKSADVQTANAVGSVFEHTEDDESRQLAVKCLSRINNSTARSRLLAIQDNQQLDPRWRALSAEYLRLAEKNEQRPAPSRAKAVSSVIGQ
jgi:hypothetical protein